MYSFYLGRKQVFEPKKAVMFKSNELQVEPNAKDLMVFFIITQYALNVLFIRVKQNTRNILSCLEQILQTWSIFYYSTSDHNLLPQPLVVQSVITSIVYSRWYG